MPGDVAKASAAAKIFVMLAARWRGHEESGGTIVEEIEKLHAAYGMSSESGDDPPWAVSRARAAEGKTVSCLCVDRWRIPHVDIPAARAFACTRGGARV